MRDYALFKLLENTRFLSQIFQNKIKLLIIRIIINTITIYSLKLASHIFNHGSKVVQLSFTVNTTNNTQIMNYY